MTFDTHRLVIRRERPAIAAVAVATRHRFRAVPFTSLTTVPGLSPLLHERSGALLFLAPFRADRPTSSPMRLPMW